MGPTFTLTELREVFEAVWQVRQRDALELQPDVSVVMLMGCRAEDSCARVRKRYPTASSHYILIASLHPERPRNHSARADVACGRYRATHR